MWLPFLVDIYDKLSNILGDYAKIVQFLSTSAISYK